MMNKINRNDRCACGSGRKYKRCCGAAKLTVPETPSLEGLMPGLRMKGGIRDNPAGGGFIAIIHTWDNIEGRGEPDEWRDPRVFATEEQAMHYYKTSLRPALEEFMAKVASQTEGVKS